jgi:molybdopterin synthase sulfur carrier subunit
MAITIRIPTPLRKVTNGADKASIKANSIEQAIDELENQFPGIKPRICDDSGKIRNFVNVYLNGEDIRFLNGIDTNISDGDEISLVPAVAGGCL